MMRQISSKFEGFILVKLQTLKPEQMIENCKIEWRGVYKDKRDQSVV